MAGHKTNSIQKVHRGYIRTCRTPQADLPCSLVLLLSLFLLDQFGLIHLVLSSENSCTQLLQSRLVWTDAYEEKWLIKSNEKVKLNYKNS